MRNQEETKRFVAAPHERSGRKSELMSRSESCTNSIPDDQSGSSTHCTQTTAANILTDENKYDPSHKRRQKVMNEGTNDGGKNETLNNNYQSSRKRKRDPSSEDEQELQDSKRGGSKLLWRQNVGSFDYAGTCTSLTQSINDT